MAKLLEQAFTIVFPPGYEKKGFKFLLTHTGQIHCAKDDNGRCCYKKVRQSDLRLLDDTGIPYKITG